MRVWCLEFPSDVPYTPNEAPKGTEHTLLEKEGETILLL